MEEHDEQFEDFLREFAPRRPRALPAVGAAAPAKWRRLAAAAAIAVAIGSSTWFVLRKPSPHQADRRLAPPVPSEQVAGSAAQPLALLPLTRLALTDPDRLDAELATASRTVLPDLRRSDSTLRVLAKE